MAAERLLIAADVSRKKRKKVIDKMAAVMILQSYLDSQNNEVKNESGKNISVIERMATNSSMRFCSHLGRRVGNHMCCIIRLVQWR